MYSSKSLTRANTSIPGMGAPITSVDVTYDGKWVVATTDHYLMVVKVCGIANSAPYTCYLEAYPGVINRLVCLDSFITQTVYENDKGQTSNAFTTRMGSRGSMPRLLRLRPEDVARTAGKPLQKGKFSWITESGQPERWIVVSCGEGPGKGTWAEWHLQGMLV